MTTRIALSATAPFDATPLLAALRGHTVAGFERHDAAARSHSRAVRGANGPAALTVTFDDAAPVVYAHIDTAHDDDVPAFEPMIRRWLDLDADPGQVVANGQNAPGDGGNAAFFIIGRNDYGETCHDELNG